MLARRGTAAPRLDWVGINLKDVQLDASVCLDALAERLAGFSPADVSRLHLGYISAASRLHLGSISPRRRPLPRARVGASASPAPRPLFARQVTNLCREAAMMPMRRAIKGLRHDEIRRLKREDTDTPLCQDDIEQSLLRINKTVSESDLGRFEEWLKEFGST